MALLAPAEESTLTLRLVELGDVGPTARLHAKALPGSFFVSLGPRFLRAYHRTFLTSPAGIALLAECDGMTVGFVMGTVDEATHYRHVVRRDRTALGARGIASLASRPALAGRFVRTRLLRYLRGLVRLSRPSSITCEEAVHLPTAGVLSHMAVDASHQGEGIGRILLEAFAETAKAQGARTVRLATATDNDGARRFYERAGWQQGDERADVDGRRWMHYSRDLR